MDEKPLIDHAHRSLRPKPWDRDIILWVHFLHEKMEILRRARNTTLSFQGQSFSIYQDYSPTVSRQRAAFGQAKRLLRTTKSGLQFLPVYGCVMMVKTTHLIKKSWTCP
jgi:hypothetical protein